MTVSTVRGSPLPTRHLRSASVLLLIVATFACQSTPRACRDIELAPRAKEQLSQAEARVDFKTVRPCARAGVFTVSSVYVDVIPRDTHEPRVSFAVTSHGQEAFVWSETRDMVPFTAIPAGTHHLTLAVGDIVARGFAGPSGTGVDTAYIRWRSGGITYELAATLRPWLTEAEVRDLADGLMTRTAVQP